MVYHAYQLLAYLNCLTLDGIEDGELQWIGTDEQWDMVDREAAKILEAANF